MNEAEMKAKVEGLEASLQTADAARIAAEQRASDAETALAATRRDVRASAVKALFSAIGREHTDDAAKAYMDMTEEQFSAVAADLKAAKPEAGREHLFSDHATGGTKDQGEPKFSLNPNDVYAARRKI